MAGCVTRRYRTIVVGAGPGGLSAARRLREDCLVLDGKERVGLPVRCGEGVSLHALAREAIEPDDAWIVRRIHRIRRIMPNGRAIGGRRDRPHAVVLHRPRFETWLSSVVAHDIRLNERVHAVERVDGSWRVYTNRGNEFRSTYLIGADGPVSLTAKRVFGVRCHLAAAWNLHLRFQRSITDGDTLNMYFGGEIAPGGYGWLFPTSAHSANTGLLIEQMRAGKKAFRKFLDTVVRPAHGDFTVLENRSGVVPVDGRHAIVTRDNAFLVGDAGGFTDPIFHGGIGMALMTGRLAAESINGNRPGQYREAIEQLPFTNDALLAARDSFYRLDDETLNQLGDLLHGKGMGHLAGREGREAFGKYPRLMENRNAVIGFVETWRTAGEFLW